MDGLHELSINLLKRLHTTNLDAWWNMVCLDRNFAQYRNYFIDEFARDAIYSGREDFLDLLVKNGFDVNHFQEQNDLPINLSIHPIFRAGVSRLGVMRILLNNGADVNKEDPSNGLLPLMFAIQSEALVHAILLLERGADPFISSSTLGKNSFEYAQVLKRNTFIACMREYS